MDIRVFYFSQGLTMHLVCLSRYNNLVGQEILREFLSVDDTQLAVFQESSDLENEKVFEAVTFDALKLPTTDAGFESLIKERLTDENVFIFNSCFAEEMKLLDTGYSQTICDQLNNLFRIIKIITSLLHREGRRGKFLFITTNPGISHCCNFPTSPIYDESVHSLVRTLAKEFRSQNISFHGICTEAVFEMVSKDELRDYRRKMKVYGVQKSPVKLSELTALVKNIALTDFRLASGNILYVGEGLDQGNY